MGQANTSSPSGQDTHILDMQQEGVLGAMDITSNLGQAWINPHSSTRSKAPFTELRKQMLLHQALTNPQPGKMTQR